MKRRAGALLLLAAALPLGLLVLDGNGARGRTAPSVETAAETALHGASADLLPVFAPERRLGVPPSEDGLTISVRPPRAPRAVQELARLLVSEPFDRAGFERAVQALAGGLAPERAELVAGLARAEASLVERLAACELLCVLAPGPGTLSAALRAELRALAQSPERGACPESAARVLVALGEVADLRALIDGLGAADEVVRARSARALASARTLEDPAREALRLELEAVLLGAPDEHVAQALQQALLALRPPATVTPDALAQQLLAPGMSSEQRLTAAEGLARASAELSLVTRRAVREELVACAGSERPAERRRALYALGALAEPDSLATLAQAARFDPDPSTRSAGVRALRAFEDRATLARIAAEDPSPEVRALATQELTVYGSTSVMRTP